MKLIDIIFDAMMRTSLPWSGTLLCIYAFVITLSFTTLLLSFRAMTIPFSLRPPREGVLLF